ncbi:CHASE2 domain-containing protein [Duganella sp. FT135W]|uniref:CHASE2 domain-containing protein n=1 Tax=Duganella flavida TaxID=2692175 RepID=A0A6L8K2U2_9BURK|nr:CHASE2 domain-containing protein [Duganella flavida]MYM21225.1 CHASE2 domain-containing protein [Duganella flavida]
MRFVLESVIALGVGLLLTFFVEWMFGEEFITRQQARAYAPIAGSSYGEGKRDDIRVLLIDDAAIAAAGQQWPARYSYSARLLRAVAQYHPKAVFVDIYYSAQRDDDSLPSLLRQVCALHEQGTKVFLAANRNRQDEYVLRPELEELAGKCFEKVAVKYTPDDIDRLAWNYTLALTGEGHGHEHGLKSAALALYESTGRTVEVEHHTLALTWGSKAAAHGVAWLSNEAGAAADESYCRDTHGLLAELAPPGLRNSIYRDGSKPVCVFHETIRAGQLTETTAEQDVQLRQLIEGKVLLIGTALSDTSDLILTPMHGRIPGVYLHAMALDNLMTFGDDYARAMHLTSPKLVLFLLASMLLVTLAPKPFVHKMKERLKRKHVRRPDVVGIILYLLWCLGRLLVSLAIAAVLLLIGQYWLGLGFLSIINVIVLTLLAEWFEFNEKLSEYLFPKKGNEHGHS